MERRQVAVHVLPAVCGVWGLMVVGQVAGVVL
jgi:hypothetical protein